MITLKKGKLFDLETIDRVEFTEFYDQYETAFAKLAFYIKWDEFAHQLGDENMSSDSSAKARFFWMIDEKTWKRRFDGHMPRERAKAAWVQYEHESRRPNYYSVSGRLRKLFHAI